MYSRGGPLRQLVPEGVSPSHILTFENIYNNQIYIQQGIRSPKLANVMRGQIPKWNLYDSESQNRPLPLYPDQSSNLGLCVGKGVSPKLVKIKSGDAAEQQCTVDLQTGASLFVPGLIAGPQVTIVGYLRRGLAYARALPLRSPGHVQNWDVSILFQ